MIDFLEEYGAVFPAIMFWTVIAFALIRGGWRMLVWTRADAVVVSHIAAEESQDWYMQLAFMDGSGVRYEFMDVYPRRSKTLPGTIVPIMYSARAPQHASVAGFRVFWIVPKLLPFAIAATALGIAERLA